MVRIRQHDTAAAPLERVWPLLADPRQMLRWHPKLASVDRSGHESVTAGESFAATYNDRGQAKRSTVAVVRVEPPLLVEYEHAVDDRGVTRIATETYRLRPVAEGVRIEQVIDFSRAQLPWWAALLIGVIGRIGRPVSGVGDLRRLAETVEAEPAIAR